MSEMTSQLFHIIICHYFPHKSGVFDLSKWQDIERGAKLIMTFRKPSHQSFTACTEGKKAHGRVKANHK